MAVSNRGVFSHIEAIDAVVYGSHTSSTERSKTLLKAGGYTGGDCVELAEELIEEPLLNLLTPLVCDMFRWPGTMD